ncbi:MAG: hypothetical protein HN742_42425 [Lentisphaerae bacterium]|nr:hypothetical protein [Lentisphaerota bacterium]MBT4818482.1 hypothetical protein [Lentisphaerota bacterium]MBT5605411.1 hypothetical protein [Lentisphaerota bacterium]MBT7062035.1 hypothetical protein [Lentisphaerota bacterium]MBT7848595.1 hypothetical protein [Lentisphaerota bacterium]
MTARDLVDYVTALKSGSLNADEGVVFGNPDAEITGIQVTWMATLDALEEAVQSDCNVVLCHERFYFVPQGQTMTPQLLTWSPNRNRVEAAAKGDLTVVRVHGSLDLICIWDDFVAALGVENPTPGTGWNKVLPIPRTTVRELVEHVKSTFNLDHVRISGDLDQQVSMAGFPWGGLGLDSNVGYQARCIELGADVLIAGEVDEYGLTFALDAGVPIIETGHALSENIGLENFAHRLDAEFAEVPVHFFSDTVAGQYR